ncbi:MAG: hypothetical protein PUE63_12520 [Lachnospiraceae bacterium]|nr:hypothetical protein [Lachnospiraceae bacterium]
MKAWSRLKERRGESLAETLVSVLIIALGLTLLASMVTAAGKLINKSERYYWENTAVRNAVEAGSSTFEEGEKDITVEIRPVMGTLTFAGETLTDEVSLGKTPTFTCRMQKPLTHAIILQQLEITGGESPSISALNGRAFTYRDADDASTGTGQAGN